MDSQNSLPKDQNTTKHHNEEAETRNTNMATRGKHETRETQTSPSTVKHEARLGCLVMRHTAVKITSFKRPALIILQLQGDGRHGQAPTEQRDERSPRGHKQDPRQDGTQQGAARPAEQHPLPAGPRPEPRVVHPRLVREELLECGRLEVGTTNFAHQQRRDELGRPCIVHGSELPLQEQRALVLGCARPAAARARWCSAAQPIRAAATAEAVEGCDESEDDGGGKTAGGHVSVCSR